MMGGKADVNGRPVAAYQGTIAGLALRFFSLTYNSLLHRIETKMVSESNEIESVDLSVASTKIFCL